MSFSRALMALVLALSFRLFAQGVMISTVAIGNLVNAPDTRYAFGGPGYGSVGYSFRIGKLEISNSQYVDFLNAVAASDPYGLYNPEMGTDSWGGIVRSGSPGNFTYAVKAGVTGEGLEGGDFKYDNKPVVFLSWFDTIRFANWLHNGQGSGDTETGAYTLLGGTPVPSNANIITRNPGARWWLPSEDEWYKAAYYDPIAEVYYDYPTGTSGRPNNNLPSADTGNSMNAGRHSRSGVGVPSYPWTDVGAYTLSASPYGTFDQGGNAEEWNETLSRFGEATKWRGLRGGPWNESHLHALGRGGNAADPTSERYGYGFRVATVVPEPSVRALLALGALTLICRKRSTRSQCWVKTD